MGSLLPVQGLVTTVGKEKWTMRSGTAVVVTRTQVFPISASNLFP